MCLMMMGALLPGLAMAGPKPTAELHLNTDPVQIHTRPPLEIREARLCEQFDGSMKMPMYNYTHGPIDVLANYSFYFNVSDRDPVIGPNITNIAAIGIIGYVNFTGDPGADPDNASCYDMRNYEFFIYANRTMGGGRVDSIWDFNWTWSNKSMYDNEIVVQQAKSLKVAESDQYNETGAPGTDGVNDTIALRIGFRLGAQMRNTNQSGNNSGDCWMFYAAAYDTFGTVNTSKDWNHTFDVNQFCDMNGNGKVSGAGAVGGGPFRLNTGMDPFHRIIWMANNNATIKINATNFTSSWTSSTLKVCFNESRDFSSSEWIQMGPENVTLGQAEHAFNGSKSKIYPSWGEHWDITLNWMCTGIPFGIAAGTYNSTLNIYMRIDGT
jgi:hypothetical protein